MKISLAQHWEQVYNRLLRWDKERQLKASPTERDHNWERSDKLSRLGLFVRRDKGQTHR